MATTYNWGYTNTTDSLTKATLVTLGLETNYENQIPRGVQLGTQKDVPTRKEYGNVTAPQDLWENVSYTSERQNIDTSKLANPLKSREGRYMATSVQAVQRETRDSGDQYDHLMKCSISFNFDTSKSWSNSEFLVALRRAISTWYDETNSSWRFENVAKGSITPHND